MRDSRLGLDFGGSAQSETDDEAVRKAMQASLNSKQPFNIYQDTDDEQELKRVLEQSKKDAAKGPANNSMDDFYSQLLGGGAAVPSGGN